MNDSNKSIKCKVESCKYNNKADSYCTLNEIKKQSVIVFKKNKKEDYIKHLPT